MSAPSEGQSPRRVLCGRTSSGKYVAVLVDDDGKISVSSLPTVVLGAGEASIGYMTQSTKHDAATYKTAVFDASASGNIVAEVADKVIKVHAITIQAQGTVTVNINDQNGGNSLDEWKLQDREGAVMPFVPYPAYWYKSASGQELYATLSAAVTTVIKIIYTDADAS